MINEVIYSQLCKAIEDYSLIKEGEKVLVAVSGGKDSLALLALLKEFQKSKRINFELFACHVRTDFHCASCVHTEALTKIFEKFEVKYAFKDIKVLDKDGKTNCFWCSWNKRKALFLLADELGCQKIAFGHHINDIVETVLMNLFFKGQLSAMSPSQELFKGRITIIRPLCYVKEELTREFAKKNGFAAKVCKCPFGHGSMRKRAKEIIKTLQESASDTDIAANIFESVLKLRHNPVIEESEEETKLNSQDFNFE